MYRKIIELFERLSPDVREQVTSLLVLTADSMRNHCVVDIPRDYYPKIEDGNGIFYFDDGYIQVYRPFKEFIAKSFLKAYTVTTIATEWLRCLAKVREVGFRRMRMAGQHFFASHTMTEITGERMNKKSTGEEYSAFIQTSQEFVDMYRDAPDARLDARISDIIREVVNILEPILGVLWIDCPSCGCPIHVP